MLLGPGHCFRDQVLESCPPLVDAITKRADNGRPELVTEGSSLETIRHMVASGLGITVLPLSAATAIKYQEDILAVRPFAAPVPFRTVALAWRVTFPRPKAIDVLSLAASQCRVIEKAKTDTPAVAESACGPYDVTGGHPGNPAQGRRKRPGGNTCQAGHPLHSGSPVPSSLPL